MASITFHGTKQIRIGKVKTLETCAAQQLVIEDMDGMSQFTFFFDLGDEAQAIDSTGAVKQALGEARQDGREEGADAVLSAVLRQMLQAITESDALDKLNSVLPTYRLAEQLIDLHSDRFNKRLSGPRAQQFRDRVSTYRELESVNVHEVALCDAFTAAAYALENSSTAKATLLALRAVRYLGQAEYSN